MLRIYVDLDDVLARTAEAMVGLLNRRGGSAFTIDQWTHFDPGRCFGLDAEECEAFMDAAHEPSFIAGLEPVEGAVDVLRRWQREGHHLAVVTGRPPSSRAETLQWLAGAGVPFDSFQCVDKYSRYAGVPESISLEKLHGADFALAIEDSLEMAGFLARSTRALVLLPDRPWNRDLAGLDEAAASRIRRVSGWAEMAEIAAGWPEAGP